MKKAFLLIASLLLTVTLATVVSLVLVASFSATAVSVQAAPAPDQTKLGAQMEELNAPWRRLRRQVSDAKQNASSLELIAKIREASKGTELLTPAMIAEIPEAQRTKLQADYTAGMKKFFGQLDSLEGALKAGDNEKAARVVAEINDFQREAHKTFRKESDAK